MEYNFSDLTVVKRSGQRVNFNGTKIAVAIKASFDSVESLYTEKDVNKVYNDVLKHISNIYKDRKTINVEDIQDIIEDTLKKDYLDIYDAFRTYRLRRAASREIFSEKQQHKFVKSIEKLGLQSNMNLNSTPMDIMHNFGLTISKEFAKAYLLENKYVRLHEEGIIRIHELPYYPLCTTSKSHLDLSSIKSDNLLTYFNDLYRLIYSIKKEQTAEQTIPEIDSLLKPVILENLKQLFKKNMVTYLKLNGLLEYINISQIIALIDKIDKIIVDMSMFDNYIFNDIVRDIFKRAYNDSISELVDIAYNSTKKLLGGLNTLDVNINNNKIVISIGDINDFYSDIYLNVINDMDPLDNVNTVIKTKSVEEVNDKIIKMILSNKNISFLIDDHIDYERFINGEKIYENIIDGEKKSSGRILLSTTTINLVRIAIMNKDKPENDFYKNISDVLDSIKNQMIQRFELQVNKYKKNFPNMFKYNLFEDSEKLEDTQKIRKVLRNGVLNIGIAGLDECVSILDKKKDKLKILEFIKKKLDQFSVDNRLNFTMSQTTDKDVLKELLAIDKSIYGLNYFDKNMTMYSVTSFNESSIDLINEETHRLQDLLNMRIDIYLKKNSSERKIVDVLKKLNKYKISFFRIRFDKNVN